MEKKMKNNLERFICDLRSRLTDVPEVNRREAVEYIEEYIADALDSGLSEEEIFSRLGSVDDIAANLTAEAAVQRAAENPGPVRMLKNSRTIFRALGRTASASTVILMAMVPLVCAFCLYALSIGSYAAGVGGLGLMIYGAVKVPVGFLASRVGSIGMGIFSLGCMAALGLCCWRFAAWLFSRTLRGVKNFINKNKRPGVTGEIQANEKTSAAKVPAGKNIARGIPWLVCAGLIVIGVGLTAPSGLPERYFSIWNSMKPAELTILSRSFQPGNIENIDISTLNSRVKILRGNTEKIELTYEQPDWMTGEAVGIGGTLSFREVSNGHLPFLGFVSRHEGMTSLIISVPRAFAAEQMDVISRGGHLETDVPAKTMNFSTGDGNIFISVPKQEGTIDARTRHGEIIIDGIPRGRNIIQEESSAGSTLSAVTTGGRIEIDYRTDGNGGSINEQ